MKLKAVWLRNIRSYRDSVIVFPEKGITVIYGDVGSGKSSILSSITFAIFGSSERRPADPAERYAYPRAEDLLRKGAARGWVQVWLRVGECGEKGECRDVVICRTIESEGGTARDKGGMILVYDRKAKKIVEARRCAARELRSRALRALGLPEKDRGDPLIFTNAIYVPQFNIYSILTKNPDQRGEAINRALNLYKYNVIRENIREVAGRIRRLAREKEATARELEPLLRDAEEKAAELEELKKRLSQIKPLEAESRRRLGELEEKLKKARERLGGLARSREEYEEAKRSLEELEEELKRHRARLEGLRKNIPENIDELREKLEELRGERKDLSAKAERVQEEADRLRSVEEDLERRIEELVKERETITGELGRLRGSLEEKKRRLRKAEELLEKGVCPLCLQKIPHEHGFKLVASIKEEISRIEEEAEEKKTRLNAVNKELAEARRRLEEAREKARSLGEELGKILRRSRMIDERIREMEKSIEKHRSTAEEIARLEEKIREKEEQKRRIEEKLESLEKAVMELRKAEEDVRKLEEEKSKAEEEYGRLVKEEASISSRIAKLEEELARLEELERRVEELKAEAKKLNEIHSFLWAPPHGSDLVALVSEIEKYVKRRAHELFRYEFGRIFGKLMEGQEGVLADIGADFSPVFRVSIGASSHEITLPSGGQVASMGLAYRLALNSVARAMTPRLSRSLLILDEPTYGFSPERVDKLREVLEELDAEQVIIVTHDRNLASVGNYRIRLELRDNMETRVTYEGESPEDKEKRRKVEEAMRRIACTPYTGWPVEGARGFSPRISLHTRSGGLLDYLGPSQPDN